MPTVIVHAYAKINLTLSILGKLPNGYHTLETVLQSVSLHDTITLTPQPQTGITLSCSQPLPCPQEENTAYKAATLFYRHTGLPAAISIHLQKRIPHGAGLAGGSADAAAVLRGLNTLHNTQLSTQALCQLASAIGADVPFCVCGGAMLATGTGVQLSPLPSMPPCTLLICKPPQSISTAQAYAAFDACAPTPQPSAVPLCHALQQQDLPAIARHLHNTFLSAPVPEAVHTIQNTLLAHNALGACMSGSGSAVFGIFAEPLNAQRCARDLSLQYPATFLCTPVSSGTQIFQK